MFFSKSYVFQWYKYTYAACKPYLVYFEKLNVDFYLIYIPTFSISLYISKDLTLFFKKKQKSYFSILYFQFVALNSDFLRRSQENLISLLEICEISLSRYIRKILSLFKLLS